MVENRIVGYSGEKYKRGVMLSVTHFSVGVYVGMCNCVCVIVIATAVDVAIAVAVGCCDC